MVKLFKIESDAFLVCMTHALSTEQEEVMGLLIGEVYSLCYDYSFARFNITNVALSIWSCCFISMKSFTRLFLEEKHNFA